jgi:SpoVK/Ycf46/Vps4 family AAA+-type ATPase
VLADLRGLVGLGPVKTEVQRLVNVQQAAELRRTHQLAGEQVSPHLVFTGNPGTGKTTVARLIGELYRAIGLLPSGHLVETERVGLVAPYVGQTAIKTRKVCESALGGVLFIDEAYSLVGHDRDYGAEAIDTLLTFMENHRGELAVVVAGYPAKMSAFLRSNPGLSSRFDVTIDFPDYDADELEQIFIDLAWSNDYDISAEVLDRVRAYIAAWPRDEHFGNGRAVRKLFTEVTRRHADALFAGRHPSQISPEQLRELRPDAVPVPPAYRRVERPREHHGYL